MMLKKYSDKQLLERTKILVARERQILSLLLDHLQEVYRRRLYADLGYSSLYGYLVNELKYSEGAAWRRVSALKLINKVPEVKKSICSGEINLTVASEVQKLTQTKLPIDTKKTLSLVKNKKTSEAKKILLGLTDTSNIAEAERVNRITSEHLRFHITITDDTLKKIKLVKDYYRCETERAINLGIDSLLAKRDRKIKKIKPQEVQVDLRSTRYVPAAIKRQVYLRANSCCEYRGCSETRNLEIDHIKPYSQGGTHELSNLRLFCRAHNQRAAIKTHGLKHMDKFIND
jgi:hypothetical protein